MAATSISDLCDKGKLYFEQYKKCYDPQDNTGKYDAILLKIAQTEVKIDEAQQWWESVKNNEQATPSHALRRMNDLRNSRKALMGSLQDRIGKHSTRVDEYRGNASRGRSATDAARAIDDR